MVKMDQADGSSDHDRSTSYTTQHLLSNDRTGRGVNCFEIRDPTSFLDEDVNTNVSQRSLESDSINDNVNISQNSKDKISGSGVRQKYEKSRSKRSAQKKQTSKELQHHTLSLSLASAFAAGTIIIWAITCTLSYKPIQIRTYLDTTGQYSRSQFEQNDRWRRVSRVGLQVLATLSIPLTSAVCAGATVVYCQRSSNRRQPAISMRQTLVLADKGWLDPSTWIDLCGPMGRRIYSPLLILSMILCGLGKYILLLTAQQWSNISSSLCNIFTSRSFRRHCLYDCHDQRRRLRTFFEACTIRYVNALRSQMGRCSSYKWNIPFINI